MENISKEIRKQIFLTGYSASIAHLASAFSMVEIMYVLFEKGILKIDPQNISNENRDIFVLSKGHGSLALYYELFKKGFYDKDTLFSFSKKGSVLGGEPCFPKTPGIECSTGSLGHGLSYSVGVAKSKKIDEKLENIYCLVGDGECEEGTTWEAIMFAVNHKLNNLTIIVDNNKIQKMDTVEKIIGIKSWKKIFEAYGCNVEEVDGHDIDKLEKCLKNKNNTDCPRVIIANTVKGKGVSIMENNPSWHWKLPNKRELKKFMEELNISEEEIEECKKHI